MSAPAWLIARPIAHRGLHDRPNGLIENTIGAAKAAIRRQLSIECDVQLTADGEVIVFHDDELDRLTTSSGLIANLTLSQVKTLRLKDTEEKIPTLAEFLGTLSSQVPLICEIKSNFDHKFKVVDRCCEILKTYNGPVAIKSFDPDIITRVRLLAPERPRGFIGESHYDDPEWDFLGKSKKHSLISLQLLSETQPDFLSWYFKDIDQPGPCVSRQVYGLPVMTWTIRNQESANNVKKFADQIVFENFIP
jgi:glycerophosphoryl diester phosphodiesterase